MVTMLVHDMGISVGDDYENIDHLLAKNVIDRELAQNIKKLKRYEKRRCSGSLASRVAVTDAYKVIAHSSKSLHF
ncbi:MAG: hypothetical protein EF813_02495, partial [Methanosarcinales archaeon]